MKVILPAERFAHPAAGAAGLSATFHPANAQTLIVKDRFRSSSARDIGSALTTPARSIGILSDSRR